MLKRATEDDYQALQQEIESNNEPGVWASAMMNRLEVENPAIYEIFCRLLEYKDRDWFPHAVHCSLAVYRLMEIANGPLPVVASEVGAPLHEQFFRQGFKGIVTQAIKRLQVEDPKILTVLVDYLMEYLWAGGEESRASYISFCGIAIYQQVTGQNEANELKKLRLE